MFVGSVAVLLVLLLVGLVIINGTYFGRERVRVLALDALRGAVNGEVVVGRIDGNLLDRFDLVYTLSATSILSSSSASSLITIIIILALPYQGLFNT